MAYRFRGRGQFTAPSSRSGRAYTYSGRSVRLKEGPFVLTWNGPALYAALQNALIEAFSNLSDQALSYMQSIVPVDTGQLRDSCYVVVNVVNDRIQVKIGAAASYAVYVELGTSSHSAQPYIRPTYDYVISILPSIVKQEVARRARN